jgi:thiamine-monophosphate kinase
MLRRNIGAAERWRLTREARNSLQARYLVPKPRVAVAEILRAHASAAMDLSDGLAGDLAKLCRASAVNAEIDVARVPLSDGARAALAKEPALIETIITGGDDYEVLACVPASKVEALRQQASAVGVLISEIGAVTEGEGQVRFLGANGEPLVFAQTSFSHF